MKAIKVLGLIVLIMIAILTIIPLFLADNVTIYQNLHGYYKHLEKHEWHSPEMKHKYCSFQTLSSVCLNQDVLEGKSRTNDVTGNNPLQ